MMIIGKRETQVVLQQYEELHSSHLDVGEFLTVDCRLVLQLTDSSLYKLGFVIIAPLCRFRRQEMRSPSFLSSSN